MIITLTPDQTRLLLDALALSDGQLQLQSARHVLTWHGSPSAKEMQSINATRDRIRLLKMVLEANRCAFDEDATTEKPPAALIW